MNLSMRRRTITTAALAAMLAPMALAGTASAQESGTVNVDATNVATLTLSLGLTAYDFGNVNPTGASGNGGNDGDAAGACYGTPVITATVTTNDGYEVDVSAVVNVANAADMGLADMNVGTVVKTNYDACAAGSLLTTPATPITSASGTDFDGTDHATYLGLNVDWNNALGAFDSTVTYTASNV